MLRRKFISLLLVAVPVLSLAACAPDNPRASGPSSGAEAGTIVSVKERRAGTCEFNVQPATGSPHPTKVYNTTCDLAATGQRYELKPDGNLRVEAPYLRFIYDIGSRNRLLGQKGCFVWSRLRTSVDGPDWPDTKRAKADRQVPNWVVENDATCKELKAKEKAHQPIPLPDGRTNVQQWTPWEKPLSSR